MSTDRAFLEATRAAKIFRGNQKPGIQKALATAMPELASGMKGGKGLKVPEHLKKGGEIRRNPGLAAHLKKMHDSGDRKGLADFKQRMNKASGSMTRRWNVSTGSEAHKTRERLEKVTDKNVRRHARMAFVARAAKKRRTLLDHEFLGGDAKKHLQQIKDARGERKSIKGSFNRRSLKLRGSLTTISAKQGERHAKKAGVSLQDVHEGAYYPNERHVDTPAHKKRLILTTAAHEGLIKGGGHHSQSGIQRYGNELSLRRQRDERGDGIVADEHNAWKTGIKAAQSHGYKFNNADARHANMALGTYTQARSKDRAEYQKFFRSGGFRKDMKVTSKESAMSTDKYFQHLLEADLSGDKVLVAAWKKAAAEIAERKKARAREELMARLAAKVKQHSRPGASATAGALNQLARTTKEIATRHGITQESDTPKKKKTPSRFSVRRTALGALIGAGAGKLIGKKHGKDIANLGTAYGGVMGAGIGALHRGFNDDADAGKRRLVLGGLAGASAAYLGHGAIRKHIIGRVQQPHLKAANAAIGDAISKGDGDAMMRASHQAQTILRRGDAAAKWSPLAGAGIGAGMGAGVHYLKTRRAKQKESTDSCYATLMEVMRKDNPELLAHLVKKARERMLYRGDKNNPLPAKKYMRLAKKQFDLHDSIKKRKAMADAASKTPIVVTPITPEVPKASGSLTPPAAPPKWSTRKKLALGAGIAAGVGLAGYGAYRWQKNRQKQQAARESTDTCLNRLLREGTPETRKLGRKISRQFARISEKAKKTGERGDYFIPHMLKLKAQRLAQQARHA